MALTGSAADLWVRRKRLTTGLQEVSERFILSAFEAKGLVALAQGLPP
jgi:hypothetical protein